MCDEVIPEVGETREQGLVNNESKRYRINECRVMEQRDYNGCKARLKQGLAEERK